MPVTFVKYRSLLSFRMLTGFDLKSSPLFSLFIVLLVTFNGVAQNASSLDSSLYHIHSIKGKISPKSVVHNGHGVFFAQNMMYRHNVTVYNRSFQLLHKIEDKVNAKDYGFDYYTEPLKGGPVECAFSPDGKYAWISNYSMSGGGDAYFNNVGCDNCSSASKYDSSFIYKINVETGNIENIVKVGSVPKYVAVSPDNKYVLVSNWSSSDLSIVSVEQNKEIKRLKIGTFPRGIVIDSKSKYAYITIMGRKEVVKLSLSTFKSQKIKVGKGPRHLCISPDDKYLYITLNSENKIAKLNIKTLELQKVKAGHQPRSMTIDGAGRYLYVVNYNDHNFTKFDANTMTPLVVTKTKSKPIGITYDDLTKNVWVSCYSGYIQVFKDSIVKVSKVNKIKTETNEVLAKVDSSKGGIVTVEGLNLESNENSKVKIYSFEDKTRYRKKVKNTEVASISSGEYFIISGAFSKQKSVNQRKQQLLELGFKPDTYFDKKKKLTYVVAQRFDTKKAALASNVRETLKSAGIDTFLKYEMNTGNLDTNTELVVNQVVEKETPKQNVNNMEVSKPSFTEGQFYLVTGVFSDENNITKRTNNLQKLNISTVLKKKNTLTYIYVGQFKTKELALQSDVAKVLKNENIKYTLVYDKSLNIH